MSPEEIKAALASLALTPQQAGKIFRHDERTIRRWLADERGVPQGISILLQLLVDGTITVADVQRASEKVFG